MAHAHGREAGPRHTVEVTAPTLTIVQLDLATLTALAAGDLATARLTSPAPLSPYLVGEERRGVWRRRARQLVETPDDAGWVTGVVVVDGVAVGGGGFHGAPDEDGTVEVGYGIDPEFRRRGHAREALRAMVDRARREPAVRRVVASVRPDNQPSLNLIDQFGFVKTGEQWDEEDGLEWVFELNVEQ
jgi:RimJ/RimL family protein N-acetyltransferase